MNSKLHILLVDDDETDRELFREALLAADSGCMVDECSNGDEALRFLQEATTVPSFIVLDLNMPVKDGRETLAELKSVERFRRLPVLMLSTSSAPFDVAAAYQSGANLFLVKPHDFSSLVELLKSCITLFSKYVALPKT